MSGRTPPDNTPHHPNRRQRRNSLSNSIVQDGLPSFTVAMLRPDELGQLRYPLLVAGPVAEGRLSAAEHYLRV